MSGRTDEALHANAFLSSILSSVHQSIVVVDSDLSIVAWSRAAHGHVGTTRGRSARRALAEPRHRDRSRRAARSASEGSGRRSNALITFDPLVGPREVVQGVILVMVVERLDD